MDRESITKRRNEDEILYGRYLMPSFVGVL